MPYYDRPLLEQMRDVLRSGVGCNGEEIAFYRRRTKPQGPAQRSAAERRAAKPSFFIESVVEGCRQLGVGDDHLSPARTSRALLEEFGVGFEDHPLEEVIPALVRRILGEQ